MIAVKEVVKDIVGEGIKHLQDEAVRGQLEAINKKRTIAGKIFDTKYVINENIELLILSKYCCLFQRVLGETNPRSLQLWPTKIQFKI